MKLILEKHMFVITILIGFAIAINLSYYLIEINEKSGSGTDISDAILVASWNMISPILLFIIGYGIVFFTDRTTNMTISTIHILLIIISFIIHEIELTSIMLSLLVSMCNNIIFSLNLILSKKQLTLDNSPEFDSEILGFKS